jgi:hypothetical protein
VSPLRSLDELSLSLQNEAVATSWYLSSDRAACVDQDAREPTLRSRVANAELRHRRGLGSTSPA